MLGISFTLCEALINGIAEASGGHGVLLQEEDRMQTKVGEILILRWNFFYKGHPLDKPKWLLRGDSLIAVGH